MEPISPERKEKQEKQNLKLKLKKLKTLKHHGIQKLLSHLEVSDISVLFKDPDAPDIPCLARKGSKSGKDNWRKLRNVHRALTFFKKVETVPI